MKLPGLIKESSVLTVSQGINLILALAINLILTKLLTVEGFGIYTLFAVVVFMLSIFTDFGLNESAAQYLGEKKGREIHREMISSFLIAGFIISFVYIAAVFISSLLVDQIFRVKTGIYLAGNWFLLIGVQFHELSKAICRGTNQLNKWALINILPRLIYLMFLGIILSRGLLSIDLACQYLTLSYLLAAILNIIILRPAIKNTFGYLLELKSRVKSLGINVMLGNSLFNATVFMDRLFISVFLSPAYLGIYQLAITIANPMVLFSRAIGISRFRNYVQSREFDRHSQQVNLIALIVQGLIIYFLAGFVLDLLSLESYLQSLVILPYILVAHVFLGLKQTYGYYFVAVKRGREIRQMALYTFIVSAASFVLLVPLFTIKGAATALIITYLFLWLLHYFYYAAGKNSAEKGK